MANLMTNPQTKSGSPYRLVIAALLPLVLLGLMIYWLLGNGSNLFNTPEIPADELSATKIEFHPNEIQVKLRNTGPDELTITNVLVNGAFIHQYEISPSNTLGRLNTATITIPYMWEEGKPYVIGTYTANAFIFDFEVPAAISTPTVSWDYIKTFFLMGAYVGIIPIFLGFLWLPILRKIGEKSISFLVALTVGVLAFLGIDTILEGLELAGKVPSVFHGVPLFIMAIGIGFFGIVGIEALVKKGKGRISSSGLLLSYMIALGIGIHNMGEGLAIGSAFVLGEVTLGTLLILGFTVHNVTEGIAILAPGAKQKINWVHLILMGLLAGVPTVFGGMIGGFAYSPVLATIFFGIATGAILQVIVECWGLIRGDRLATKLQAAPNWIGLAAGFLLMYLTALFVAG
ncbi:ZIP family metal transporter [Cohnella luojiensis]|uniref:Metal transporter n=1 Tax=Cohnella luojiensis TaxID=652876 RepID=A0A4Y8M049_9BACL|nr:metal transporter [Cohnella luojiensis]TFE27460.1 metal transporter [Cohnella luojiensis]